MVQPSAIPEAQPGLRISVLGPLRASRGGDWLNLGPARQQALLAALVLRSGVTIGQRQLLEDVWGSEPPDTGVKVIPVYVYRLRKCLDQPSDTGSSIERDRHGYRFVGDTWIDSMRLEEDIRDGLAAADAGDLNAAVATYSAAMERFSGEPLSGLPGPFAVGERLRLTERKLAVQQRKVEWQLSLGLHHEVVGELSALLESQPHSEQVATLLMRALDGSGRKADALAVYTRARRRLVDELGVEPGQALRRVHQRVLRGESETVAAQRPPDVSPRPVVPRTRNDLPVNLGEPIGRDDELVRLTEPTDPLKVSVDAVDGVAGAGKTTLAVRAARMLRDQHPDGCLFVDLRGHAEGRDALPPARALRRLLRAVGVDHNNLPDDVDELAAAWRAATHTWRLLLVLDDASSAEQVRPLLPAGPGSKVLVTSRQRLTGLETDHRVSVGPLELIEAEALLTKLVGESRAGNEREAVRELARLCGGLPLALRIAGARLQNRPTWTFEYLVSRLTTSEYPIGELAASDRSVEVAFQLSYDQLPATRQRAFRLLGLSPTVEFDKVTLAAMAGMRPEVAETELENLVDASLLQQPATDRYRFHDLVAAYARRLAHAENIETITTARRGVLRCYTAAARHASDSGPVGFPTGPVVDDTLFDGWEAAVTWLDAAGGELTDVVAYAAAAGEVDYACWVAEALIAYFIRQDRYHECRVALESVLPLAELATDRRMVSSLRTCLGIVYSLQGDYELASDWFTQALKLAEAAGDGYEQARALLGLAGIANLRGQLAEAEAQLNEVLELARPLNDHWVNGTALGYLGYIHQQRGDSAAALECFTATLTHAEAIGTPRPIVTALVYGSGIHLDLGEYEEAAALLRRAIPLAESVGDRALRAYCLTRLGTAEQGLGHPTEAIALHHEALRTVDDRTGPETEIEVRGRLGASYLAMGDKAKAREQYELVLALLGPDGDPVRRAPALEALSRC